MQSPEQMYYQTKNNLIRLINSQQFRSEFGERLGGKLRESLNTMFKHLDELVKDRKVMPTDQERSVIASATNLLISKVIYEPITPVTRDFTLLYIEVLKNWNSQIGYQYDLDIMADTLQRLITQHLTLVDAVNVLKQLIRKCERLLNYEPPAFALARHYMDIIKDKMEKCEPINEYEQAKVQQKKGDTHGD